MSEPDDEWLDSLVRKHLNKRDAERRKAEVQMLRRLLADRRRAKSKPGRKLGPRLGHLSDHLLELYREEPSFIEKITGNRAALARMLGHKFKGRTGYQSVAAAEKFLKRLPEALKKLEKTNS